MNAIKNFALILSLISGGIQASELHINCMPESDEVEYQLLKVLIGVEGEVVALKESSKSEKVLRLSSYAVVIDITEDFNNPEFRVLTEKQFALKELDNQNMNFNLKIKGGENYICSREQVVFPNPAITRSN